MAVVEWLKKQSDDLRELAKKDVRPFPVVGGSLLVLGSYLLGRRVYLNGMEDGMRRGLQNLTDIGTSDLGGGIKMFQLYPAWNALAGEINKVAYQMKMTELWVILSTIGGFGSLVMDRATRFSLPVSNRVLPWVANAIHSPEQKTA